MRFVLRDFLGLTMLVATSCSGGSVFLTASNQVAAQESRLTRFLPENWPRSLAELGHDEPDEARARSLFQEAEAQFAASIGAPKNQRVKGFLAASDKYREAAGYWPNTALEEDALFMAAEGFFFSDRYPEAEKSYGELIKKYPNTKYLDKLSARRFATAEYWLTLHRDDPEWRTTPNFTNKNRPRFDTFGHAVKIFDRIRFDDPTGMLSDDATMAAANAQFSAGRYRQADTLYSDLRTSFADSEHQFEAHFLGLKCKMKLYEGPDYDGQVLDEGEKLIKQMYRLFPQQAQREREYLVRARGEIRLKKAQREWTVARYYDRRKEYGAARFYYDLVRYEYRDTSLAERAETRLAEIGGRPDVPPDRMEWLTKAFPTPDRAKPLIARNPLGTSRR